MRDPRKYREVVGEIILTPKRCPRENKQKDSQFQAEDDVDDGEQSAHVYWAMSVSADRVLARVSHHNSGRARLEPPFRSPPIEVRSSS